MSDWDVESALSQYFQDKDVWLGNRRPDGLSTANYCFINSVVQILLLNDSLREKLMFHNPHTCIHEKNEKNEKHCLIPVLIQEYYERLEDKKINTTIDYQRYLTEFGNYKKYETADALEFLNFLLDCGGVRNLQNTLFSDCNKEHTSRHCETCEIEQVSEDMVNPTLSINGKVNNISLRAFLKPSRKKANGYQCKNCRADMDITSSYTIASEWVIINCNGAVFTECERFTTNDRMRTYCLRNVICYEKKHYYTLSYSDEGCTYREYNDSEVPETKNKFGEDITNLELLSNKLSFAKYCIYQRSTFQCSWDNCPNLRWNGAVQYCPGHIMLDNMMLKEGPKYKKIYLGKTYCWSCKYYSDKVLKYAKCIGCKRPLKGCKIPLKENLSKEEKK
jgi:hypothetical protein